MDLTTGEWIAVVGIVLATVIGVIQVNKKNLTKSKSVNVKQSQGAFSKGKQKVNLKVEQNDK